MRIAVDGPAGAGKSTVAKRVGAQLGITYIDSGAMYRAVSYMALRDGVDTGDPVQLSEMLASADIRFESGQTVLNGENIEAKIRTPEVSEAASAISALAPVRAGLVAAQRAMGAVRDVIMDGRDIGTNVFPDAEYKFYVTAAAEERAARRQKELAEKGIPATFDEVIRDIRQRDLNDSTRELNPLQKAEDAVEIDTTGKSIDEVVQTVIAHIR